MRTQKRCLGCVAIVVDDYDRAIEYYTDKLGFTLVEDTHPTRKATVTFCWLVRLTRGRKVLSVINAAAEFSCSFRRMIFGAITMP